MNHHSSSMFAIIVALIFPVGAIAGPCDAYFTFDGNLQDSGGNGNNGMMIMKGGKGSPRPPTYVEGKFGQAISLNGQAAVVAPVDLHPDACPQVTITAWVKVEDVSIGGYQYILSRGGNGGQGLLHHSSHMQASAGGMNAIQKGVVRSGQWVFVAGVFDNKNKTISVHVRNRSQERALAKNGVFADKPDIWIGAKNDLQFSAPSPMVIDDVRIYGRILSAEEITQVQAGTRIPGDQFDLPTAIPGDQFDSPTAIPGDQFDLPTAIPGDQFDSPTAIPGDQFDSPTAIPGDQFDQPTQIPGDLSPPPDIGDAEPDIADPVDAEGVMPELFGDP